MGPDALFVLRDDNTLHLASGNNMGTHRIRKGQSRRFKSIGIVERRICGKEGAKNSGFISRRASYRAIRMKQRGKARVAKVFREFFG